MQHDVVIIGSGMGGLSCGAILAREGLKVCVLEQNKQIGGTLQTFARDKIIFDSGVHYVGGLDEGQNLYKLFKFLGILEKMKLRKMDEDVFDAILFKDDPVVYKYAQGYENFIQTLAKQFPGEEDAIRKYCAGVKSVCSKFPLYNLRSGEFFEKYDVLDIDTQTFLESITSNKKLQNVLAATSLLYAGTAYKTPFYVHALVINSYIESSWRFVDGGSQIARALSKEITSRGGILLKNTKVILLKEEGGTLQYVLTESNEKIYGKIFISNVHPAKTIEMTESSLIKKAFRNRIKSLENSISIFSVNIVIKKNTLPYLNHNYYYFDQEDAWCVADYNEENWPRGYALYFSASSKSATYADGVTVMTYMRFDEMKKWEHTFNTASKEGYRGDDYEAFKKEKAQKLFDSVEERFPGFKNAIKKYYVTTPLSVRDYIGTDDGTLYGVVKDYREPMRTFISPRTKVPNLFLTGQNLNLHGILGVSVSAVVTCSEILGKDYILEKIRTA